MKTEDAIKHFGSKPKLCEALNLNRMNVFYWGYWVPRKHAQFLFFNHGLEYSNPLYSGQEAINHNFYEYVASPWIASTRILEKEINKGVSLYFYDGQDMTLVNSLSNPEIKSAFRKLPVYTKVAA